jgi:hypothetical protein
MDFKSEGEAIEIRTKIRKEKLKLIKNEDTLLPIFFTCEAMWFFCYLVPLKVFQCTEMTFKRTLFQVTCILAAWLASAVL